MLASAEVFHGNTPIRRGRGRPSTGNARELISVRLDRDIVARLRTAGPGWQSQINPLLRAALHLDQEQRGAVPIAAPQNATFRAHDSLRKAVEAVETVCQSKSAHAALQAVIEVSKLASPAAKAKAGKPHAAETLKR